MSPIQALLSDAAVRAARYLEEARDRCVAPSEQSLQRLRELDHALPESPSDPETVLEILDRIGSPATVTSAGGRYFGLVIGGALPAAVAANWLAGAWDQNAGLFATSPAATVLEEISLRWLLDLLQPPAGSVG